MRSKLVRTHKECREAIKSTVPRNSDGLQLPVSPNVQLVETWDGGVGGAPSERGGAMDGGTVIQVPLARDGQWQVA